MQLVYLQSAAEKLFAAYESICIVLKRSRKTTPTTTGIPHSFRQPFAQSKKYTTYKYKIKTKFLESNAETNFVTFIEKGVIMELAGH